MYVRMCVYISILVGGSGLYIPGDASTGCLQCRGREYSRVSLLALAMYGVAYGERGKARNFPGLVRASEIYIVYNR